MSTTRLLFLVLAPLMLLPVPLCGFGFLASFEYPGVTVWKVGYATAGIIFLLLGIMFLVLAIRGPRRDPSGS